MDDMKEELLKLYNYFELEYGNISIFEKLVEEIEFLSGDAKWDRVKEILDDVNDPLFLINRGFIPYHHSSLVNNSYKFNKFLNAWSDSTAKLLLRIVRTTKDYDFIVQQILNYEDFLLFEMRKNKLRKQIAVQIYDLRGIDFFLIHFFGGKTTALDDDALWKSAELIPEFLKEFNRIEEAKYFEKELQKRKQKLKEILSEYNINKSSNQLEEIKNQLKLYGERFWYEYLSINVWNNLSPISRQDLIDSFVLEFFLLRGILNGWSQIVLTLCKVLERELSLVIFNNWTDLIKQSNLKIPDDLSIDERKEIKSIETTFKILKSCVKDKIHPPSLGQMVFILRYWNNELMNRCTSLFSDINIRIKDKSDFLEKISKLNYWLEERHILDGERPTIIDLRNSSAHPGSESEYSWDKHIEWLKDFLGKPPKEALKIIVSLKENLNDIA